MLPGAVHKKKASLIPLVHEYLISSDAVEEEGGARSREEGPPDVLLTPATPSQTVLSRKAPGRPKTPEYVIYNTNIPLRKMLILTSTSFVRFLQRTAVFLQYYGDSYFKIFADEQCFIAPDGRLSSCSLRTPKINHAFLFKRTVKQHCDRGASFRRWPPCPCHPDNRRVENKLFICNQVLLYFCRAT